MDAYLNELMSSTMPLPVWAICLLWLILFASANLLFVKGRALSNAQNFFVISGPRPLHDLSPRLILFQALFAAVVFTSSLFLGGPAFVLLAGGWVILSAVSTAINLRSLLYFRALSLQGAADGSVTLSAQLSAKNQAFQLFAAATLCLCAGILVAHLALLGGALFLTATATGILRKVNAKHP